MSGLPCGERRREAVGVVDDAVELLPVDRLDEAADGRARLGQGLREGLDVGERAGDRALVAGHDLVEALEHVVGALGDLLGRRHHVLDVGGVGEDRRHLVARARGERRRVGVAARQGDHRDAGEHRRIEAGAGVGAQGRGALDLDHGDDPARVLRQQAHVRDLADLDAVEGHGRALGEPADAAGEHDAHGLADLAARAALQPEHEAEGRHEHREGEGADEGVVRTSLHRIRPDGIGGARAVRRHTRAPRWIGGERQACAHGACRAGRRRGRACRGSRSAARDGRSPASPRSCPAAMIWPSPSAAMRSQAV